MKTLFQLSEPGEYVGDISPHCALLDPPMHAATAVLESVTHHPSACGPASKSPPAQTLTCAGGLHGPNGYCPGASARQWPSEFAPTAQPAGMARFEFAELALSGQIDEMQAPTIDASIIGLP